MKNNRYFLNTLLALVLFAVLTAGLIIRVVAPAAVLPTLNIPNMVLVSVIALFVEHLIAPNNPRCYICIPVLAIVAFAVLPLMAGFACQHTFWKIGLVGGVVFTAIGTFPSPRS